MTNRAVSKSSSASRALVGSDRIARGKVIEKWAADMEAYRKWLVVRKLLGRSEGRLNVLQAMLGQIACSVPGTISALNLGASSESDNISVAKKILENILSSAAFGERMPDDNWDPWIKRFRKAVRSTLESECIFDALEADAKKSAQSALGSFFSNWLEAQRIIWEDPEDCEYIVTRRIATALVSRGHFEGSIDGEFRARRNFGRSGGLGRSAKSEKSRAMQQIEGKFLLMLEGRSPFKRDALFARDMLRAFPVLAGDAAIRNNCSKWRKKFKESAS
jgi:hypothetical protein